MVLSIDLKLKIKKLYEEKKFKEIITLIEKSIHPDNRSPAIFNIMGVAKLSEEIKTKEDLITSISYFKSAIKADQKSNLGKEAFANFVHASVELSNIDSNLVNFDEHIKFYNDHKDFHGNHYEINNAMKRVFSRLNNTKEIIFHLKKMLESDQSSLEDLCSYIYNNMFESEWKQEDFFKYTKLIESKLIKYEQNKLNDFINTKNDKIKIGFLSADIRNSHSITYFLRSVLKKYERKKYEIYLILNQKINDQTTNEFKSYVDQTINIINLNDVDAINKIRGLNLDFIFDLMGITSSNRMVLFKNRIAKKQIVWLGYCNTTGIENMDYIFSDNNLIHQDEINLYSEKIIFFPKIWNSHYGLNKERYLKNTPMIKNNYITFGSFNNFKKINENVINTWSQILNLVKNSRLILKSSINKHNIKRIKEKFKSNGISTAINFCDREKNFEDHIEHYNKIDIALDTFPYPGVTTTFEALFMGVPVLTMAGYNFNSRCGESIIKNLNLSDLVAKNKEDYVSKAINLSKNINKLSNYREKIFTDSLGTPLFNTEEFSQTFYGKIDELYSL